ncbi:MAG TPA: amidase family protein [Pirellulaceae bacterium]|nr:amidase family protein [Pirellulaceae bacterium]
MPQPSTSPLDWSATEIAQRIAGRQVSATEVAKAFIARIEEVNPALNAVVIPRFEQALAEAAAADQQQARGQPLGPLHGVPMTVKECFHVAGTKATIGLSRADYQQPATEDGVMVARLRRAGAIILGKTNLPQLMIWHECDNPVYGRTNNPWDLSRTPGGSTGGEAAIIAARGSPLGLGNDLGGSIRVPCHFCGIHGFKPTSFRLTRKGTRHTLHGFEAIVTQPGPMARQVADLWLMLQVLADNSNGDNPPDVPPAQLGDPSQIDVAALRVAVWTDDRVFPPSAAVQRAVREAAAALAARGATIVELNPAEMCAPLSMDEMFATYCSLIGSDGGAGARRLAADSKLDWRVARLIWLAGLGPVRRSAVLSSLKLTGQKWMARLVSAARPVSADQFWQLSFQRLEFAARFTERLRSRGIDAILCPPHALPATPHLAGFDLIAAASYSMLFNFIGFPAGVVSTTRVRPDEAAGRWNDRDVVLRQAAATDEGSAGLPIGVQVAALPWRDDIVLAVMGAIETSLRTKQDWPIHELAVTKA